MPPWVLIAASAAAIVASAPPARALSCPSGPFIVFFDLDKAEVTAQARLILDNLISFAKLKLEGQECGPLGRIAIVGHADRSGPERHNLRLSRLRAANIRAYLSAHGLPDDVLTSAALGESAPLVETPDGVQKAENRRVEVVLIPPAYW